MAMEEAAHAVAEVAHVAPDFTGTLMGIVVLAVFVIGYYFIAAEEKYIINKAKPALFIGTFLFMLVGVFVAIVHPEMQHLLETEIEHLILEIAEIFFFLFVAMTYIESLIERDVFEALKYNLVSKGLSYRRLFWITGTIAFFLSPIADNLTTALILSTVLLTLDKENKDFLVPGAINIVIAANAGGAWSPFGDITTLMAWTAGKGDFGDFVYLFPAAVGGWLISAFLLSRIVPDGKPHFDPASMPPVSIKPGGKVIIGLGVFTIASAVLSHQALEMPAMWGMMFGLSLLKLFVYMLKKQNIANIDIFHNIRSIEIDTLLFFFGILAAVGALHFVGYLTLAVQLYDIAGPTGTNIGVGMLSAIVDNVPVMSAVLKADPQMTLDQWMLVTLTVGIGGSLISFGSAAGVGVMGKMRGIYTFGSHMKYAWMVAVGYICSIVIWYVQFEVLGFFVHHPVSL